MDSSYLALIEFFIAVAVLLGWAVLELVGLRLDRKRREEDEAKDAAASRKPDADADGA